MQTQKSIIINNKTTREHNVSVKSYASVSSLIHQTGICEIHSSGSKICKKCLSGNDFQYQMKKVGHTLQVKRAPFLFIFQISQERSQRLRCAKNHQMVTQPFEPSLLEGYFKYPMIVRFHRTILLYVFYIFMFGNIAYLTFLCHTRIPTR